MARLFTGSGVAIVTPFTQDGVNFDVLGKLIDMQLAGGTDAIIIVGTTGEPSTMTKQEKEQAIAYTVERVAHRVPVIAGTGGNNTAECILASKKAQELGADGLLIVTPYYNKTTPKGLIEHMKAIADNVTLPIIVYNVPPRTGMNVAPATLAAMAGYKGICGMKEASANIAQVLEMKRLCGDKIDLYSGEDGIVVPTLACGGVGVISVAANIVPRLMHDMVTSFLAGDVKAALELQWRVNPLVDCLFSEVNPIPVKTALGLMGYAVGPLRAPLTTMGEAPKAAMVQRMRELGLPIVGE